MTIVIRESFIDKAEGKHNVYWAQELRAFLEPMWRTFHIDTVAPQVAPRTILMSFKHDKDEQNEFHTEEDRQYH